MTKSLLTRSLRILAVTAVFCISAAPALQAEPVTVASGRFAVPWDDPTFFLFTGANGFQLTGLFPIVSVSPQLKCFTGCLPGTAVDLSAVAGGESAISLFPLGLATRAVVDGTDFVAARDLPSGLPRLSGTLRFDAPSIVLPPFDRVARVTLTAPFVLSGEVIGFAAADGNGLAPLFHVAVTGQGIASLGFVFHDAVMYRAPGATYTFAATPEPATLALFATGLVGLVVRNRNRRRAR